MVPLQLLGNTIVMQFFRIFRQSLFLSKDDKTKLIRDIDLIKVCCIPTVKTKS